jgi:lipoprotein-releasing system permease protein
MRRWVLFVARRHVRTRRREKGNATTIFAVLGIAAGAMTLVAVLSVMNGFQLGTIEDILEVDSYHLRIDADGPAADEPSQGAAPNHGGAQFPEAVARTVSERPGVSAAVPFLDLEVLATGFFRDLRAIRVRALPGDVGRRDEGFRNAFDMVAGVFNVEANRSVVMGIELARALGVAPGDSVELVSLEGDDLARGTTVELVVTGTFRSGYLDFDQGWAFVSLRTARDVLGAARAPTVGVKLEDRYADQRAAAVLEERLGAAVDITSWRQYNRSIFGALRLEKNLMTILIGLIFLVVAGNMMQSLRRSVVERAEEIAILKALGAPPRSIQLIFVGEGGIIGLAGGGVGVLLGLLIAHNVNAIFQAAEAVVNGVLWGIGRVIGSVTNADFTLFSPRYFYITEVPVEVIASEVIGIFLFAFLCAAGAALLASTRVSRIRPAEVLRNE